MQASDLEQILIQGSEVGLRVCVSNNLLEDAVSLRITAKLLESDHLSLVFFGSSPGAQTTFCCAEPSWQGTEKPLRGISGNFSHRGMRRRKNPEGPCSQERASRVPESPLLTREQILFVMSWIYNINNPM